MPHQRQIIREAVKAALAAANIVPAGQVYETRVVPWQSIKLPAITVYALTESSDSQGSAPRRLRRKMQLEVIAATKSSANVDDALDDLSLAIERAMHADWTFGSTCGDSVLTGTTLAVQPEGEKPIGFVVMTYEVTYYTAAPEAEDVTLDSLNTVDVKTSVNGSDPAEDILKNLES